MGKNTALPKSIAAARVRLQERLDYQFKDARLLDEAMTHASIDADTNNQRLEFLGDRVINLIIADAVFAHASDAREGILMRLYVDCIDNTALATLARDYQLDTTLWAAKGIDFAQNHKVLADALEALLGAIWLDGGLEAARDAVGRIWGARLQSLALKPADAKTRLNEYALAHYTDLPVYNLVARSGADHAPHFTIEVALDARTAEGEGASRRQAEQAAAAAWLKEVSA